MNQSFLQRQYQAVLRKYQKFSLRFDRQLQQSESVSNRKLHQLQQRLVKFRAKLARLQTQLKLAGTGLAMGAFLLGNISEAEAQTPKFSYNMGLLNIGEDAAPTFADLDNDGDLDALVGENDGTLNYFENTGNNTNPTFATEVTNPFGLTDVGSYTDPTFADIDGDGDFDVFVGEDGGNIHYFENTGDNTNPAFATVVTNPFGFVDVGDRTSLTFADLDADGDLDALVGEQDENLNYFENTGDNTNPLFATPVNLPFGLTDSGTFGRYKPRFIDIDDDNDYDVVIGELFGDLAYFENTGNNTNPTFATHIDNPFGFIKEGNYNAMAFADLDNDGDLDIVSGNEHGLLRYFENTGTAIMPDFTGPKDQNPFDFTSVYRFAQPTFVDIDDDGDLDAYVASRYDSIPFYRNVGDVNNPSFVAEGKQQFTLLPKGDINGDSYYTATFADLDGDGDFDVLVGANSGDFRYFENTGDATTPAFAGVLLNPFGLVNQLQALDPTPTMHPFIGTNSIPELVDIDGDGDLDLFSGEREGSIVYFENTGDATTPAFGVISQNPFGLTDIGRLGAPAFADLDKDGDLDAYWGNNDGNIQYFENTGNGTNPAFTTISLNPFGFTDIGRRNKPEFADIDNDGDLDVFIGGGYGHLVFFENVTPASSTPTWNGSSWSPSAPTTSDNTVINGNYDTGTDGALNASNLTVNSTFTLRVDLTNPATIAGDLENNGTIIVESDASFIQTAVSPSNSGSGTYTMERLADKSILVYNYFSSPVIGETIADVFATNGTNFYSFDVASQNWSALATATLLDAGDGFAATGNGNSGTITRTFTSNTGFNSGDITKAITIVGTGGAADDDWNLVGNPYPSGLDFQSFYTSNSANIGTAIYLWDSDGNDVGATDADYATMTSAGAVNSGAGGTTYPNAIVASGQGFFVEALNNANITFSNSHRSATNNTFFREKEMQRVWLSAKHENGAGNQILIAFAENADEKSDLFDGKKWSESQTLSFYMPVSDFTKGVDSEKLAIQGLPSIEEGRIVELGIEAKQAGKFTFALDKSEYLENQAIFLHDLLTNEFINITKESYTVVLEEGDHSDRFTLRFVGSKVTGVEEDLAERGVSIYSSGQRLTINFADAQSAEANIAVYDLQGRKLFATSVENQTQVSLELPLSGIFIVKVENARGVATKKVYLD